MALFHSFLWLSNIPVCVCVCVWYIHNRLKPIISQWAFKLFTCLDDHDGGAMIIEVHVPFPIRILIFLWICPGVGLLDHGIALFLVFKGTSMPLFTVARQVLCVYYPPTPYKESVQRQCTPHGLAFLAIGLCYLARERCFSEPVPSFESGGDTISHKNKTR